MDADLQQRFRDGVYQRRRGVPPRQRPTIDDYIQKAIQELLNNSATGEMLGSFQASAGNRESSTNNIEAKEIILKIRVELERLSEIVEATNMPTADSAER